MTLRRAALFDYAVATRAVDGVCGDRSIVREEGDRILVAVADGLGHGREACRAASLAMDVLATGPIRPPGELVADCHRALAATRGVVIAVAVIDAVSRTMTWLAVGNVEGKHLRETAVGAAPPNVLTLTGGIVGYRLPHLHPSAIALHDRDVLAFATDGIDPGFDQELLPELTPRQAARRVLARCHRGSDDGLVLIGRWRGGDDRR
jgi:phosphoserine phosphatase RsbX